MPLFKRPFAPFRSQLLSEERAEEYYVTLHTKPVDFVSFLHVHKNTFHHMCKMDFLFSIIGSIGCKPIYKSDSTTKHRKW